jgi:hypothetical protein
MVYSDYTDVKDSLDLYRHPIWYNILDVLLYDFKKNVIYQGRIQESKKGLAGKLRPERKTFKTVCKYNLLMCCFQKKYALCFLENFN